MSSVFLLLSASATYAQPVQTVSEYRLAEQDLQNLTERLGIEIFAGFNNIYRFQGLQFQLNYLKCAPVDVEELMGVMQQLAPKNTLARTYEGVYEIITLDHRLARKILLNLDDISLLEKGKLIPMQLPGDWMITAEIYPGYGDLRKLEKSLGKGLVEMLNQVIRVSGGERVQINYFHCDTRENAERIFGVLFAASPRPRSVRRLGALVIEVVTTNSETIDEVMSFFR